MSAVMPSVATRPTLRARFWPCIAALVVATLAAASPKARAADLVLEEFFAGHLAGEGRLDNRKEGVVRPFAIDLRGAWDGRVMHLAQDVAFADGERQRHVWAFTRIGLGRYEGRRDDVIGVAEVTQTGASVRLKYKAHVMSGGSAFDVAFDESFTLSAPGTVATWADVSLFFIPVATTQSTIRKLER